MSAKAENFEGRLLFKDSGNAIVAFDMQSRVTKPIVKGLPFSVIDGGFVKKSNEALLVATLSNLVEIDLISGHAKKMGNTDFIYTYFPELDTLIYVYNDEKGNERLFQANLSNISHTASPIGEEVLSSDELHSAFKVIPISKHEIIFPSVASGHGVWRYDLLSKKLHRVENLQNCKPIFYRNITNQVICYEQQYGRYSLIGLHDEHKEYLTVLDKSSQRPIPILYIPQLDSLLYTQLTWTWSLFNEQRDLYEYNLKTGKSRLLKKDFTGWAVYMDKK